MCFMKHSAMGILLGFSMLQTACLDRDHQTPEVNITEPSFEGMAVAFEDLFFIGFEVTDDRPDGGLWRAEIRGEDGVTVLAMQAGLWEGHSTGEVVVSFILNHPGWNSGAYTVAVVADDAAGNRGAAFRSVDYTGAPDVSESAAILTSEADGSSSVWLQNTPGEPITTWENLPASHSIALAPQTVALAHVNSCMVSLYEYGTGTNTGSWEDPTSSGSEPLVRRIHALELQSGFLIVHAGGVTAIDPSGQLLLERFSEAPWSPMDAFFSEGNLILWERNIGTQSDRIRSWDFITGGAGPIIPLAVPAKGVGAAGNQSSTADGSVFVLSEELGLTLCNPSTGTLTDLCPLIGNGVLSSNPFGVIGTSGGSALFEREGSTCYQSISDISSGSVFPNEGATTCFRKGPSSIVQLGVNATGAGQSLWVWMDDAAGPELIWEGLPLNAMDVGYVIEF